MSSVAVAAGPAPSSVSGMVPTSVEAAALSRLRKQGDYADYARYSTSAATLTGNPGYASTTASAVAPVTASPPADPATLPPTSAADAQTRFAANGGKIAIETLLASAVLPNGRALLPSTLVSSHKAETTRFRLWKVKHGSNNGIYGGGGPPNPSSQQQVFPFAVHKAALLEYFKRFNPENAVPWMVDMTWDALGSAAWDSLEFEKKGSTAGFKPGTVAPPTPEQQAAAEAAADQEYVDAWQVPPWAAPSSDAATAPAITGGPGAAQATNAFAAGVASLVPSGTSSTPAQDYEQSLVSVRMGEAGSELSLAQGITFQR